MVSISSQHNAVELKADNNLAEWLVFMQALDKLEGECYGGSF